MKTTIRIVITIAFSITISLLAAHAQKNPGAGAAASGSPASSAGLPGISYDQPSWSDELIYPKSIPEKKRVVACYKLTYGRNAAQPFILTPLRRAYSTIMTEESFRKSCINTKESDQEPSMKAWCKQNPNGSWTPCSPLDEQHPIIMGQTLVIGIEHRGISEERLKILNLNVTTVQSSPINPTPIRPSFGAAGGYVALGEEYYLTWPYPLPGDVIATLSVNMIYTPPVPGERWSAWTYYPFGSIVTSESGNGHYHMATTGGVSGKKEPALPTGVPASVADGAILWMDSGPATAPSGGKGPILWLPKHSYNPGDSIVDPYNGHVYVSMTPGVGVTTGDLPDNPFSLPIASPPMTQMALPPSEIKEGSMVWRRDSTVASCSTQWRPGTPYAVGSVVGPYNRVCYRASTKGVSGPPPMQPYFPTGGTGTVRDGDGSLTWLDLGVVPPASVTGAQPTDQTVNLLSLALPQTHSKSYYNISSGVVYSTVHNRSFGIPPGGATTTATQVQTSSSPTIDPVLFFTAYPLPVDAERHCSFPRCLWQTSPGVSFGLSLASPSSSFYLGGSFELLRNIQVVVGNNWAKTTRLPQPPVALATNATTATTVQKYSAGAYYGLTFNISGFVQSLFSGGASSSKSSSSTPSQ